MFSSNSIGKNWPQEIESYLSFVNLVESIATKVSKPPQGFSKAPWVFKISNPETTPFLKQALALKENGSAPQLVVAFAVSNRSYPDEFIQLLERLKPNKTTKRKTGKFHNLVRHLFETKQPIRLYGYKEQYLLELALAHTRLLAANFAVEAQLEELNVEAISVYDPIKCNQAFRFPKNHEIASILVVRA